MSIASYTVPTANIVAMVVTFLIAVGLPIILCIVWKCKAKSKLYPLFLGCGTFVVFALVLEQFCHVVVQLLTGTLLMDNIVFYAIYGGLAAGVFEETGRLLAMKFCMKKDLDKKNAIMYGIGHGGIEAMLLIGMTYLSNLVTAILINSQGVERLTQTLNGQVPGSADAFWVQVAPLWELPASQFLMAGVERISAMGLHIVMSYLVFWAVKNKKLGWYGLSILVHAVTNAGIVLLAQRCPLAVVEAVLAGVVAVLLIGVVVHYRKQEVVH